jgi:uncharacterized protein YjbJ (UPF0337 family)
MGATDETKGKLKEAAGSLTGSDDLRHEGQAQQEKSEHESEAAKKRAEANAADAKAEGAEDKEKGHQGT